MARLKVYNRNKFDVGVKLINPVREQNIKAGSFAMLDEEDVYYLDSICTLFKRGMLVIENETVNQNINCLEIQENIKPEEEIANILKGNFLKMKSELAKITEPHLRDNIYNIAVKVAGELSGSKLKYLNDYCGKEIMIDEIG